MPRKKKEESKEEPIEKPVKAKKVEKETPTVLASEDTDIDAEAIPEMSEIESEESEGEGKDAKKRPDRYFEGVGRRKTAVARVRLYTRAGEFVVNEKPYADYFPTPELQKIAEESLQRMKLFGRFRVSAKLSGGGSHSQAEALRHGLANCLVKFNPDFRKRLRRAGYLTRDPRMKERKKFGLKKARRAPQWSKR